MAARMSYILQVDSFYRPLLILLLAVAFLFPCIAQSQTVTTIYNLQGAPDGTWPEAPVIRDDKGNLYGTTEFGGGGHGCAGSCGTVFEVYRATGEKWEERVLYRFKGEDGDGAYPVAALLRDAKGNLYGTTRAGGVGYGVVFELSKSGETVLYAFTGGVDGGTPLAPLITDGGGNLYGTTSSGGTSGSGTVFELAPASGGRWAETVLYSFQGGTDGLEPSAGLYRDSSGNLFGTTIVGGNLNCMYNEFVPGCGTVFELSPGGNGTWKESVLYAFAGGSDGANPSAPLIRDSTGNFYSTTTLGGSINDFCILGCGTIFELSPTGSGWTESVVTNLTNGTDDCCQNPSGTLLRDAAGNFYGTTTGQNNGYVYELSAAGQFTSAIPGIGANPIGLVSDGKGHAYGVTTKGGNCTRHFADCGTVFIATP